MSEADQFICEDCGTDKAVYKQPGSKHWFCARCEHFKPFRRSWAVRLARHEHNLEVQHKIAMQDVGIIRTAKKPK